MYGKILIVGKGAIDAARLVAADREIAAILLILLGKGGPTKVEGN